MNEDRSADEPGARRLPAEYYIAKLAIELEMHDGWSEGSAPVRPELFAPGTSRIRTGLLATFVDLVAGHTPNGPFGPTVDLRVEVFGPSPVEGRVHLISHALRAGKRLIVTETVLSDTPGGAPFARAISTFINNHLGAPVDARSVTLPPMAEASFDEFIGPTVRADGALEVEVHHRISNGMQGTVQGGAQATVAEMAAEHAAASFGWGHRFVAADLDIRYLSGVRVGPLVARAAVHLGADGRPRAAVRLTDGGNADSLVSYVALTLDRAD